MSHFHADEHYVIDEKAKQASLTEEGVALGEELWCGKSL